MSFKVVISFCIVDKYYVVDVIYPKMSRFLAPYDGVCYHLLGFRRGTKARGQKELFNHAIMNVIECFFSVLRSRWPILKLMAIH